MIYTKCYESTGAGAQVDIKIDSFTVPKGYKAILLELGFTLPATGIIKGYIGETKVDEIRGSYAIVIPRRILVNRELVAGQYWKFTYTCTAGGVFVVLAVYELIKL